MVFITGSFSTLKIRVRKSFKNISLFHCRSPSQNFTHEYVFVLDDVTWLNMPVLIQTTRGGSGGVVVSPVTADINLSPATTCERRHVLSTSWWSLSVREQTTSQWRIQKGGGAEVRIPLLFQNWSASTFIKIAEISVFDSLILQG